MSTTETEATPEVQPRFKEKAVSSRAKAAARSTKATKATKSTKKAGKAPKATKATGRASAARKAPKAPKPAAASISRSPSTVSKEGTKRDAFTGEELPVTAFPTRRLADGTVVRGDVARKNMEAYVAHRRSERQKASA